MDIFARYGGEEFVIALPETGLFQAVNVAERLSQNVEGTPIDTGHARLLHITVSTGVTVTGVNATDVVTLLRQADKTLYKAKNNGRNRVEIFRQPTVES